MECCFMEMDEVFLLSWQQQTVENKLVVLMASSRSLTHIVPVSLPIAIRYIDGELYFLGKLAV